jgi:hypothetical protein
VTRRRSQADEAGRGDHRRGHRPGGLRGDVAADDASDPTYIVDGIVHYCVTNMPGAVGRTSTYALCNVTFPYVICIKEKSPTKPSPKPSVWNVRSQRQSRSLLSFARRKDDGRGSGDLPRPSLRLWDVPPSRRFFYLQNVKAVVTIELGILLHHHANTSAHPRQPERQKDPRD